MVIPNEQHTNGQPAEAEADIAILDLVPTKEGTPEVVTMDVDIAEVETATDPTKPGRVICISGFADSSRDMANRVQKHVEIWGLNRCYTYLKRWDRWFEVHEPDLYSGETGLREGDYLERLKSANMPVYMQHPDPNLPNSRQLPYREMIDHFGIDYYTTSIAYMLAMAIYEHDRGDTIAEIKMFGVDMSAYSEYSYQRPCVEFWLGVAWGRGITVTIPRVSPVLKAIASYGRHSERLLWSQADERLKTLKDNIAQQTANVQAAMGAANEYHNVDDPIKLYPTDEWTPDELEGKSVEEVMTFVREHYQRSQASSEKMRKRWQELQNGIPQLQADLNASLGAHRECQHWLTAFGAPQSVEHEIGPLKLPR